MLCELCPRKCCVDRDAGQIGYCGVPAGLKVARAALHMWEEPCISGSTGSGAIFFSGCNMGCIYCQNHAISSGHCGLEITADRLEEIFYELQAQGAANINLVTPDHEIMALVPVLTRLKQQHFPLPVVYNSSSYVTVDALKRLDGLVDIYLPDLKYMDTQIAKTYSRAADYPETAMAAIAEMVRQIRSHTPAGETVCSLDAQGKMRRGVIVRHLLLPGQLYAARQIVKYLHRTYGEDIYISLMNQYTPMPGMEGVLAERVDRGSYENLIDYACRIGVDQGYIQEGDTARESFIPSFDYEGVQQDILNRSRKTTNAENGEDDDGRK